MRLRLAVISDHRRELSDQADHEFSEAGGVVGRSATADWSLPDPTKTVSSRHALFSFADGTFRITDTSTNGVYLNSVDVPLGRGATMPLRNGDTLYLGPYVVRVEILADAVDGRRRLGLDSGWKAIRSEQPAQPVSTGPAGLDDLLSRGRPADAEAVLPPGLAPGPVAASPQRPAAARPRPAIDPIAGLEERPADDAAADIGRRDEDLLGNVPMSASRSAGGLASPASPRAPAQIIPATFDPLADTPPPPRAGSAPQALPPRTAEPHLRREPPPLPHIPATASPPPLPAPMPPLSAPLPPLAAPLPPLAAPVPARTPAVPPASRSETAPPTDVMALLRLRALAAEGPQPPAEPVAAPGGDPAGDSLLAAVGVDPAALTPEATRRAVTALAAFVLRAAEGLVEVLETRRTLKDELHLEHTRLGATDNNPFKFFATGREALRQVLALEPPGFVSLADGAEEAFADLHEHELATMTAVQATAAALLARLSPAAIEASCEAGGFLGRIDKARLWDRYAEAHGRTMETLDVAVAELIAQHYARALRQPPGRRTGQPS